MVLPVPSGAAVSQATLRTQATQANAQLVGIFGQDAVNALTELMSYSSLEQQVVALAAMLLAAQNTHNKANPNAIINRVGIAPNFTGNEMTVTLQLPLDADAVELGVADGTLPILG